MPSGFDGFSSPVISNLRPICQVGASEWTKWSDGVATKAMDGVDAGDCWGLLGIAGDFGQAVGPETPEPPTLCHVRRSMCSTKRCWSAMVSGVILGRLGLSWMFQQPRRSQGPCPLLGQNPSHVVSGSKKPKEAQRRTQIINTINTIKSSSSSSSSSSISSSSSSSSSASSAYPPHYSSAILVSVHAHPITHWVSHR